MFVPNILMIALEVKQSLIGSVNSTTKRKIYEGNLPLEESRKLMAETFEQICIALEFDDRDEQDLAFSCNHVEHFGSNLYSSLRSDTASEKKFLWLILSYSLVPGISRFVGMWAQEDVLDKGMPSGKFWFIPTINYDETGENLTLDMPVANVINWLIDLISGSVSSLNNQINPTHTEQVSALRTLYKWRKENTIPTINKIHQYFNDKAIFEFTGCFETDETDETEIFETLRKNVERAIDFIKRKKLTAKSLACEIPVNERAIELFLQFKGDEVINQLVVDELAIRYAKPSNKKIRQRLLFARMAQDGYKRLVQYFHPGLPFNTVDPKNKVIQLIRLFEQIYNASMASRNQWIDEVDRLQQDPQSIDIEKIDQDIFEKYIPPLLKMGACASLMISGGDTLSITKILITERLADYNKPDELEDILPFTEEGNLEYFKSKYEEIRDLYSDPEKPLRLINKLLHRNAYETLQKLDDYQLIASVLSEIKHELIPLKFCLNRLSELAVTSEQRVFPLLHQLEEYLYEGNKAEKGMRENVQSLIDDILKEPEGVQVHKPSILRLRAHHALFQGDFDEAKCFLNQALDACQKQYTGDFHSAVAADLWGLELMGGKLNTNNHKKLYRIVLQNYFHDKKPMSTLLPESFKKYTNEMHSRHLTRMGFEDEVIQEILPEHEFTTYSIETLALKMESRFWNELYKPYAGIESVRRPIDQDVEKLQSVFPLLHKGDENQVKKWIEGNSDIISRPLSHAQNDTVIHYFLMTANTMLVRALNARHKNGSLSDREQKSYYRMMMNTHGLIALLIDQYPELANKPNIFGDTPLHLSVSFGNPLQAGFLLNKGVDGNMKNNDEFTPLELAHELSDDGLVNLIANFKLTSTDPLAQSTPSAL